MPDVAAIHYPWLPVRLGDENRYDNLTRIRRYHGPLLQSHGTADELIPIALAQSLFAAAPSPNKKWLTLANVATTTRCRVRYYDELAAFLEAARTPQR